MSIPNIRSLVATYQLLAIDSSSSDAELKRDLISRLPDEVQHKIHNILSSNQLQISTQSVLHRVALEEIQAFSEETQNKIHEVFLAKVSRKRSIGGEEFSYHNFVDDDMADKAFQALSEVFSVDTLDYVLGTALASFEACGDKNVVLRAIEAIASFDLKTIQDTQDKEIKNTLRDLSIISKDPVLCHQIDSLKGILIQNLSRLILKMDHNEVQKWSELLAKDSRFDFLGSVLTTTQETDDLPALEMRFNDLVHALEEKETRLSDSIDQQRDPEWTARKDSWERFKDRIIKYPTAILFDNVNNQNRQKQYYALGARFIAAAIAIDNEDTLSYYLDNIDRQSEQSFLDTCRTGWVQRISQLERIAGIKTQKDPLIRVLELSKNARRDLVNAYVSKKFPNGDVHTYEKAKAATNKIFNLGYSKDDLGAEANFEGINRIGIDFIDLNTYIEEHFVEELLGSIQRDLVTTSAEERENLFEAIADAYFADAKEKKSILFDRFEALLPFIPRLYSWIDKHRVCSSDALKELSDIKSVLSEYFDDISIKTRLSYQDHFLTQIAVTATYARMRIDPRLSIDEKINIFKEKLTNLAPDIQSKYEHVLAELDKLMSHEQLECDFEVIKTSIISFIDSYPSLIAAKNRSVFLDKLKTNISFASITLAMLSKCLDIKIFDSDDGFKAEILNWMESLDFVLSSINRCQLTAELRGLAVINYAAASEFEMVKFLLSDGNTISRLDRHKAMHVAVLNNYVNLLQFLMPVNLQVNLTWLGRAVCIAAKNNNLWMMKSLLSGGLKISDEPKHNSDLQEFTIRKGTYYPNPTCRGRAVCYAAQHGNLEMLEFLLPEGAKISPEEREESFFYAVKNNDLNMARVLYSFNGELTKAARGYALIEAVKHDNLDMVKFLLPDSAEIDQILGPRAFECAVGNNNLEIVRFLLTSFTEAFEVARVISINYAVNNNSLEMLMLLISDGVEIFPVHRELAILAAATYNNQVLLELLLSDEAEICKDCIGRAIAEAARVNNLEIVQFLLSRGYGINIKDRGPAVIAAVNERNLSMLELLLPDGAEIDEDDRMEAITDAIESSQISIVKFLLNDNVYILEENKSLLLEAAIAEGNQEIILFLKQRMENANP